MGKIHELLASEGDADSQFKTAVADLKRLFQKRPDTFQGFLRRLEMFDEARKQEERQHDESKELVHTVDERLESLREPFTRFFDLEFQKECMNQDAKADIILYEEHPSKEPELLASDVPVTYLLFLERRVGLMKDAYQAIPVLDPSFAWAPDDNIGKGVYRLVTDEVKDRTEKQVNSKVLYDAKDGNPAQVEKWYEDRPVGRFTRTVWTGAIKESRKRELIERFDELLRSVKRARARANDIEVVQRIIGEDIFGYINK